MKILKILRNVTFIGVIAIGMSCGSQVKRSDEPIGIPTIPEIRDVQTLRAKLNTAKTVFAFNFNGNNGNPAHVECERLYDSGRLCASAAHKKQLNPAQIQILIDITTDTATYNGSWSGLNGVCFVPHLGFAFFQQDSLVAQVNICFLCSGIRTIPYYKSDGLTLLGAQRYEQLAQTLGLEVVHHSNATF